MEVERGRGVMLLIVTDDGRLLMHLRDDKPTIVHPATWAGFGGAIESGETADEAVRREMHEETGIHVEHAEYLTEAIDEEGWGFHITVYVARGGIAPEHIDLQEGAGTGVHTLAELRQLPVPPFIMRAIETHLEAELI
jgi:8-oxo-dGTP diphosphatase